MGKASLESEVQELRKQVELLTDREESRDEVEEPPEDEGSPDEDLNLSLLRAKIEEFMVNPTSESERCRRCARFSPFNNLS
jgi:hypothetical protein